MSANISNSDISANDANEDANDDSVNSQQADVYTVERIVDQRMRGKKKQYLVKWKDYPDSVNTWEPPENIYDKSVIEIFEKEQSANNDESSSGSPEVIKKKSSSKRNASTLEKQPRKKLSKSSNPVAEIQTDGNSMSSSPLIEHKSNITAEGDKFSTAPVTTDTPVSASATTNSANKVNGFRNKINNSAKKVDRNKKNVSANSDDTVTVAVTINGITVPFSCEKSKFNL